MLVFDVPARKCCPTRKQESIAATQRLLAHVTGTVFESMGSRNALLKRATGKVRMSCCRENLHTSFTLKMSMKCSIRKCYEHILHAQSDGTLNATPTVFTCNNASAFQILRIAALLQGPK